MRQERLREASKPLISFENVTYSDENAVVHVRGKELQELFAAIASGNGWPISDLLGNVEIAAGERLPCRIINALPAGYSFLSDDSGYIVPKIKGSKTAVGHSYFGDGDQSCDWKPLPSKKRVSRDHAVPRRTIQRECAPKSILDPPFSLGSAVGKTQAMPIRLHRAAALAASKDPDIHSKNWILHVCGNKKCGVVAHYRPGTESDNELDEEYHTHHRGRSIRQHAPWQ